jgi:hypothetical protein
MGMTYVGDGAGERRLGRRALCSEEAVHGGLISKFSRGGSVGCIVVAVSGSGDLGSVLASEG